MRSVLGLLLLIALTGCTCGRGGCSPCGSSCGSGCGPIVCCEHCCYCRKLDALHTNIVARRCAQASLPANVSCDYSQGYSQAFVDVALGRTGVAPPVPPQRYWSVCFRSPCGDARAADWYAGYNAGAELALAQCGGECNRVPSSGAGYYHGPVRGGDQACGCSFENREWSSCSQCPCGR